MALFTGLPPEGLSDEELVKGSVVRAKIEDQLNSLKGREVISVKPLRVRHPAAVPGHPFLCVTCLPLLRYLQWEQREPKLSMPMLVELLEWIRVVLVRSPDGTPKMVLEQMDRKEALVFSKLNLVRFILSVE